VARHFVESMKPKSNSLPPMKLGPDEMVSMFDVVDKGINRENIYNALQQHGFSQKDAFRLLQNIDDEHIINAAMRDAVKLLKQSRNQDTPVWHNAAANPFIVTSDNFKEIRPGIWDRADELIKANDLAGKDEHLENILNIFPL